jgi:SAM-dependent methyltransferase
LSGYVHNVDVARLRVGPSDRVADVGCGAGALAVALAGRGLDVTGVEPSSELRAAFSAAARARGVEERCAIVEGTVENLPFGDGELAAVVMTEVLEHVAHPAVALAELYRALAPGGAACVAVPTAGSERIFSFLHPRYIDNATHLHRFRRADLRSLLGDAGFRVERIEGRNFASSVVWLFHALLRSDSDHAGRIHEHLWIDRWIGRLFGVLERVRLSEPITAVGNRVFPKSWYVYAVKPP